jgi:hypothetical protein
MSGDEGTNFSTLSGGKGFQKHMTVGVKTLPGLKILDMSTVCCGVNDQWFSCFREEGASPN